MCHIARTERTRLQSPSFLYHLPLTMERCACGRQVQRRATLGAALVDGLAPAAGVRPPPRRARAVAGGLARREPAVADVLAVIEHPPPRVCRLFLLALHEAHVLHAPKPVHRQRRGGTRVEAHDRRRRTTARKQCRGDDGEEEEEGSWLPLHRVVTRSGV
uniref:Uncharacterized protein n=1 Tax=Arundo donax TaxID=35708 RepID=A0A0A9B681_ARUDO